MVTEVEEARGRAWDEQGMLGTKAIVAVGAAEAIQLSAGACQIL